MFKIYSSPTCPWCDRAESLLRKLGLPCDRVPISQLEVKFKQVPQIYLGEAWIGGYTDLEKYLSKLGYNCNV